MNNRKQKWKVIRGIFGLFLFLILVVQVQSRLRNNGQDLFSSLFKTLEIDPNKKSLPSSNTPETVDFHLNKKIPITKP